MTAATVGEVDAVPAAKTAVTQQPPRRITILVRGMMPRVVEGKIARKTSPGTARGEMTVVASTVEGTTAGSKIATAECVAATAPKNADAQTAGLAVEAAVVVAAGRLVAEVGRQPARVATVVARAVAAAPRRVGEIQSQGRGG